MATGFLGTNEASRLLDHELGRPDYRRFDPVYAALYTQMPTKDGGGVETATMVSSRRKALPAGRPPAQLAPILFT